MARYGKDNRFLLTLHVEEYRDIAVASSRGCFVHAGQIQLIQHTAHVVVHNAPQALIEDFQLPRDSQHRHLLDQQHSGLFEQQGKIAARPSPGCLDTLDAMLGVRGTRACR